MAFALAHALRVRRGLIVIAAKMKHAVDDVKSQLGLDVMAAAFRFDLCLFHPDHKLAAQRFGAWIAQRKTQDIGGLIVIQIALIELLDCRIIDEGEADLSFGKAFFSQNRSNNLLHSAPVNRNDLLRTCDGDSWA